MIWIYQLLFSELPAIGYDDSADMFHSVRGQYGNKFEPVHEKSSFPKKIALTILRKASKVKRFLFRQCLHFLFRQCLHYQSQKQKSGPMDCFTTPYKIKAGAGNGSCPQYMKVCPRFCYYGCWSFLPFESHYQSMTHIFA